MNEIKNTVSVSQAAALMILSRMFSEAADIVSYGGGGVSFGAVYGTQRLAVIVVSFLLTAAACVPLYILLRENPGESFISLIAGKSPLAAKAAAAALLPVLLFLTADSALRFEKYALGTVFDAASPLIILTVIGAVSLYALFKGLAASARAGFLASAGFILFFALLITGLAGEIKPDRLSREIINEPGTFLREVVAEFSQNYELPVFAVLCPSVGKNPHRVLPIYLAVSCGVILTMTFLCDTVFGTLTGTMSFPFYSLSSLADIGIIHRLNGLDIMLWTAAACIRLTFFSFAAGYAVYRAFGAARAATAVSVATLAAALLLAGAFIAEPAVFASLTKIRATGIPLTAAGVLLPAGAYAVTLSGKSRNRKLIDN